VTSKYTSETICLTSYKSPRGGDDLLDSVKIWEACRATSAASSYFDPIAIGPHEEEFVDGGTGANNPVYRLWEQAENVWGPDLDTKIECLISIGTGSPPLKRIGAGGLRKTLIAFATDTEQVAEVFRHEKSQLEGRYFRFNVTRGLEYIGLEEAKEIKNIAAATRYYISTPAVLTQMRALPTTLLHVDILLGKLARCGTTWYFVK
jgi:predicted acylesterase/phospholipase RssA